MRTFSTIVMKLDITYAAHPSPSPSFSHFISDYGNFPAQFKLGNANLYYNTIKLCGYDQYMIPNY